VSVRHPSSETWVYGSTTSMTMSAHITKYKVVAPAVSLCYENCMDNIQWLKWSCEAGDSPDEARWEQTPYPFHTH